ncbi:MAG TPA: hypothetical protein VFM65_09960 [Flavobacteriaceae bacterium]|nr:hypothetical protein [Flavobacteriaceae bacterium]
MTPDTIDLRRLKTDVENFTVKKCRLHHEKIAYDEAAKKPLYKEVGDEKNFERVGFCAMSIRKKRLGCAHSPANARFGNMLKSLELYDPTFIFLWEKFDRVINGIYALDHQKGNLEKRMAENPAKETKQKIKDIESKHSELTDELVSIRNKILEKIDCLLS